jgi:Flp pilus assembly protein TadD
MAEIFVGRVTEQDEFRRVLDIARGAGPRSAPGEPDEGHVVLICGLGGIGKSTLLKRLRDIASGDHGGGLVAGVVDCEDERRRHAGDYVDSEGPPIWRLLDRLYLAIQEGAADKRRLRAKAERAFAGFRTAMAAQPELARRAAEIGIGRLFGRRRLSAEEISALIQMAVGATEMAGLPVPPPVSPLVGPVARTARAALDMVAQRRDGLVEQAAYDALMSDLERLVIQFADAIRTLSRQSGPLVLFIDTGELLSGALDWLRVAMRRGGSRVVWVLGMRLETESDAGFDSEAVQFRRAIHDARLRQMPLSSFDDRTAELYLQRRLGAQYPDDLSIDAVMQLTHGIPLAVSLAVDLLASGLSPARALAPFHEGDVSLVIRNLARRYLVHARTSPSLARDLPFLYGLALLHDEGERRYGVRRPGLATGSVDADALAALWDVEASEVPAVLDGLAARHDFVLSGRRRLHQEVREAILLFLLDPLERPAVREQSRRGIEYYRACANAEDHETAEAPVGSQRWRAAVAALLWHTFWVDPSEGLQMLRQLFGCLVIFDTYFTETLVQVAAFFVPVCPVEGQRLISGLQQLSVLGRQADPSPVVRDVITGLIDSPADPLLAAVPPAAVWRDLLRIKYHNYLNLTALEQAAAMVRAADDVSAGSATARFIASAAHALVVDASRYIGIPPPAQETIIAAMGLTVRFEPGDSLAQAWLGCALRILGHDVESEAACREAVRLAPSSATGYIQLAGALNSMHRYAEAEAALREAIRLEPKNAAENYATLSVSLRGLARYPEAETACREALRLKPDSAYAYMLLGEALSELGRHLEATTAFREAMRLAPGDPEPHNKFGVALDNLELHEKALAAFQEAVQLDPTSSTIRANLGSALHDLGRHSEAEAVLREASCLDPKDSNPQRHLGYLLADTGRHAEAEAAAREAIRLEPGSWLEQCALGYVLSVGDGHVEAEAAYREAIRLNPNDDFAQRGLGTELVYLGRYAESEAVYREAIRLNPNVARSHGALGYILRLLGRYAEAEAVYREAIRLNPNVARSHGALGYILLLLGRYAEAEAAYREAIRLNPNESDTYCGLGYLHLSLTGKIDEAEIVIREALRIEPNSALANSHLGSFHVITGDLEAAKLSFARATELDAPQIAVRSEIMLGAIDRAEGSSAAEDHFMSALQELDFPSKPTRWQGCDILFRRAELRALALVGLGRQEEAVEELFRAITARTGDDLFQRKDYDLFLAAGFTTGISALCDLWRNIITKDPGAVGPWGDP